MQMYTAPQNRKVEWEWGVCEEGGREGMPKRMMGGEKRKKERGADRERQVCGEKGQPHSHHCHVCSERSRKDNKRDKIERAGERERERERKRERERERERQRERERE